MTNPARERKAAVAETRQTSTPDASERQVWEARLAARMRGEPVAPAPPATARLAQLAELFGLTDFDADVVATLWTSAYSPRWRAEVAAHDDASGQVTVAAIMRALRHPPRVRLPSESALRLWRIVAEHPFVDGTAALSLDPHIVAWLDGEHELDRALIGQVEIVESGLDLPSWRLDAVAERLRIGLRAGNRYRVRLDGDDPAAALACAAALARRLGLLALRVRANAPAAEDDRERAVRVQRQSFMDRCAPCFHARDVESAWPSEIVPFPVQFVVGGGALSAHRRLHDVAVALSSPDADERRALWMSAASTRRWPQASLDDLALRCEASVGEILRAAASAPADAHEASLRLREHAVDDLGALAQRLNCTFVRDDLVVPAAVRERLDDVTFEARERARLWAEPDAARLYPQGRGLVVLLAGPPGTGKTMASQVFAAELGLELLRVDISRILSKWVGETAQHLQQVLSSAASRRAVLLFDEADALFGKRVEDARAAQDHFVNMDISHLMIALESYTGIVLLATNLKANLDPAFVRRIRHAIDFPMPDASARAAIWLRTAQALFSQPLTDATRDAIARVARIEASGAQIKNAALSATFAARRRQQPPDVALLGAMLARELAKDGAGMSARELTTTLEAAP